MLSLSRQCAAHSFCFETCPTRSILVTPPDFSRLVFSSSSPVLNFLSLATRIHSVPFKMNKYISIEVLSSSCSSNETIVSSGSDSLIRPKPSFPMRDISLRMIVGKEEGLNVPLGFCLGLNDDIVVADTDNHRILVFDLKSGDLKYHFGSYGANPGCFVQPRKITVIPQVALSRNDNPLFVICDRGQDRSRLQIFTPVGGFVRQIRLLNVDIVSGLVSTQDRKIILVDSIRADVLVLSEFGELLLHFNCGMQVKEPGDLAFHNSKFFICDFQGHVVCVFDSKGDFLHNIGSEFSGGLLNYPNGIDISNQGEILVADSHGNQFHLHVFNSANGRLLTTFRYPNKTVSGLAGLKCAGNGNIVSLMKNIRCVMVFNTVSV